MNLFDASVPYTAYNARPFDIADLDAHADAPRLWATILRMQDDHTADVQQTLDSKVGQEIQDAEENAWSAAAEQIGAAKVTVTHGVKGFALEQHPGRKANEDVVSALDEMLAELAEDIGAQLGDLATDMANLAEVRTAARNALAEITAEIATAENLKGVDWRAKHDLEQGRVNADLLAKAFKKDELAYITMLALRAIHRLAAV